MKTREKVAGEDRWAWTVAYDFPARSALISILIRSGAEILTPVETTMCRSGLHVVGDVDMGEARLAVIDWIRPRTPVGVSRSERFGASVLGQCVERLLEGDRGPQDWASVPSAPAARGRRQYHDVPGGGVMYRSYTRDWAIPEEVLGCEL